MCHVFRCQVPARTIANALRDICKKILIERSLAQSSSKLTEKLISSERRHTMASRLGGVRCQFSYINIFIRWSEQEEIWKLNQKMNQTNMFSFYMSSICLVEKFLFKSIFFFRFRNLKNCFFHTGLLRHLADSSNPQTHQPQC